jgi:cellulose synthase/poly-beta-1,6-N-acetylglucosamine synthase-like glycosyltransferase
VPRLSIVIPAFRGNDSLESGLVSVLENRPDDCEVLVVNACGYSDPYALADEVRFLPATAGDRVSALNAALSEARGDILHILDSGALVEPGWTDAAVAAFADRHVACVAPLVLSETDHIESAGLDYHASGAIIRRAAGKQVGKAPTAGLVAGAPLGAALYRRQALLGVGMFDPTMGAAAADIELGLRLQAAGWQTRFEPECRLHAAPVPALTWIERIRAARQIERLFWRQAAGAPAMVSHPCAVAADVLSHLGRGAALQLAGRIWGAMEWGDTVRYRRLLAELQAARPDAGVPVPAPHFLQPHVARRRAS